MNEERKKVKKTCGKRIENEVKRKINKSLVAEWRRNNDIEKQIFWQGIKKAERDGRTEILLYLQILYGQTEEKENKSENAIENISAFSILFSHMFV